MNFNQQLYNILPKIQRILSSAGKNLNEAFLIELAKREEPNRSGKMTVILFSVFKIKQFFEQLIIFNLYFQSIIFIRDKNSKGQEISGYIDYAHRLKTEDFDGYFAGKKKLLPKPSDLSFYNWENQMITSNNTPNYQVIAENVKGILFKNKRDRKILNVDPHVNYFFIFIWSSFFLL